MTSKNAHSGKTSKSSICMTCIDLNYLFLVQFSWDLKSRLAKILNGQQRLGCNGPDFEWGLKSRAEIHQH